MSDDDFVEDGEHYDGLVMGKHTMVNGEIASLQTKSYGKKVPLPGYSSRIELSSDEQFLVDEVNRVVDEKIASGEFELGAVTAAGYMTRASYIHSELSKMVQEYREEKANQVGRFEKQNEVLMHDTSSAVDGLMKFPEASPPEAETIQSDFVSDLEDLRKQVKKRNPERGRQFEFSAKGDDFSCLGIPNLGNEPKPAYYAKLKSPKGEIKLRWNWGIRLKDADLFVLVRDNRAKKADKAAVKLKALDGGVAELWIAKTKEELAEVSSISVIAAVQVFEFGCFTFYLFLPEM